MVRFSRYTMRPDGSLPAILLAVGLLAVTTMAPPATAAGENDTLARQIDQLIRAADKDLAAGQVEAAGENLGEAEKGLAELAAADPRHRAVRPMTLRLELARKKYQEMLAGGPPEAPPAVTAPAAPVPAEADARLMIDLYDKYYPRLDLIHGNSLVYGVKESDAREALAQIEAAEALLPEFAGEVGRLAEAYGTESLEIGKNLRAQGAKVSGDPGGRLAYLIEAIGKVDKSRQASAAACAQKAETLTAGYSGPITDARLKRLDEVRKLLAVGHELDPRNERVDAMLAEIGDEIVAAAEQMRAEIDAARWAGNVTGFPGPGNAGALAGEALRFFRSHEGWGGNTAKKVEVLDACVRGPWQVAERDIFGRVIGWRLPVHVAVTDPELRPRNIARVYELSILAQEGAPGRAPKAPPFAGYWVGASWMMRLDRF